MKKIINFIACFLFFILLVNFAPQVVSSLYWDYFEKDNVLSKITNKKRATIIYDNFKGSHGKSVRTVLEDKIKDPDVVIFEIDNSSGLSLYKLDWLVKLLSKKKKRVYVNISFAPIKKDYSWLMAQKLKELAKIAKFTIASGNNNLLLDKYNSSFFKHLNTRKIEIKRIAQMQQANKIDAVLHSANATAFIYQILSSLYILENRDFEIKKLIRESVYEVVKDEGIEINKYEANEIVESYFKELAPFFFVAMLNKNKNIKVISTNEEELRCQIKDLVVANLYKTGFVQIGKEIYKGSSFATPIALADIINERF